MVKPHKLLMLSALAFSVQTISAHGAWIAERVDMPTIVYGHGSTDDAYKPEKVTLIKGFDASNQDVSVKKLPAEKNVALDISKDVAYVGFILDNGYWSKNAEGKWKNLPKNEVDGAETGGRYLKNGIAVLQANGEIKPVEGLNFQIVPLTNPLAKKAGDTLEILVLFNGKPVADKEIVTDYTNMSHEHGVKTNADGKATVTIRNQGLNVIAAGHTEKLENDPKADKVGYFATLSFTLEHLDHH